MGLKQVNLENFRNYQKAEVKITSDLVLILGENATGKTNFIESLYFISHLKSFRVTNEFLVNFKADHFSIRVEYKDKIFETVVMVRPALKRSFKIDGQKVSKHDWRSFRTVLFVPNDLNLFSLGPLFRRRFLNETLAQIDKIYAANLISLEHVLKQRSALLNKILNQQADFKELGFWNQQLAMLTVSISSKRRSFLGFIQDKFNQVYERVTGFKTDLEAQYKPTVDEISESVVMTKLDKYQNAEIRSGLNLVGPHREDFLILKQGLPNVYNSSRGEMRSQILALKLLQAEYLSTIHERPIILLDDVFSELDETRRTKLLENLSRYQIFITSTEEHHLPRLAKNVQILKVENNLIS